MKTQLIIPKKISVGFQNRTDTYTGKLAYVIYTDDKGVLRKETSWNSWRDKKIEVQEFDNVPTSGFVLNKKVGDHGGGWDSRKAWIRIWDPRNFEFEISVSNLLFILEETNSIKGKGLDGEFVYSWDKADLVLLPASSKEYKSSSEFTGLQTQKINQKEMKEGFVYLNKTNEQVLYLGRLNWHQLSTEYTGNYSNECTIKHLEETKKHVFVKIGLESKKKAGLIPLKAAVATLDLSNSKLDDNELDEEFDSVEDEVEADYWIQTGFTKIAKKLSEEPSPLFPSLFEKFKKSKHGSKLVGLKAKPAKYNSERYWDNHNLYLRENNQFYVLYIQGYGPENIQVFKSLEPVEETANKKIKLHRKFPENRNSYGHRGLLSSKEEIEKMDLVNLFVENEHGALIQI